VGTNHQIVARGGVAPNLRNYGRARAAFSWEEARGELDGPPDGGGLNIAHEAVDRHVAGALRDKTAIRWLGKDGSVRDFSFAQLRDLTNRFANALGSLGVGKGDRVYALMGRIPELLTERR
jgi:acetyl-CoA synthetase